jgi:HD-like signal output (HDOD) protein
MSKQAAVERIGNRVILPSSPEILTRITMMMEDPQVGIPEIGAEAGKDPGITSRLLRLANSAHYGLSVPVVAPEQAVCVIGVRMLRNIALQTSVVQQYRQLALELDCDLAGHWRHAALIASMAYDLSRRVGGADLLPEEMYTCGLMHDVGKVVLLDSLREDYVALLAEAARTRQECQDLEQPQLGFTHADVGAMLAERWNFPPSMCRAIGEHHCAEDDLRECPEAAVVVLADRLAYALDSTSCEELLPRIAGLAEELVGLQAADFSDWVARSREMRAEVEI